MRIGILFLLIYILNAQNITLDLKWKNAFQFAGFYIAKEKGFYKKYNLNVTFKELSNNDPLKDVLTNKAQFAIGNSSLIYFKLHNKPIIALMPIFENTPIALVSTDTSVKTLKDLQNHIIHTPKFGFYNIAILSMLKKSGVDIKKLKISNKPFDINTILHKKGIYVVFMTDQLYYLQKNNIPYKVFSPLDEGIDVYGDTLFTSKKFLKSNPKTVKNFVKATKEGWNWAKIHINETVEIILNKYNTQHLTKEKLIDEAYKTLPFLSKNYLFKRDKIATIKLLYQLIFNIKNNFSFLDFVYSPYILNKKEKNFIKNNVIKCITTSTWPPFNFLKNDNISGISIDFWNIIKQRLYLKSSCYSTTDFSNVLESIKNKKADVNPSTTMSAEKEKFAIFSNPYITYPIAIATKTNVNTILSMKTLFNKKIAIGKNYTAYELIKKHYPKIKVVAVTNTKEGLKLLEEGKVFGVIDVMPVLTYLISQNEYTDIAIKGSTPFNFPLQIMIRNDYTILQQLINRVIEDISIKEKNKLLDKYISVKIFEGVPYQQVKKKFVINNFIIGILVLILIIVLIIYFKLKKVKKELEIIAKHDKLLTEIYNRLEIDKRLNEEIEKIKRYNNTLSVIYFDIDHFKKINDTYGHKTGDMVLKEISKLIKNHIRLTDIFGRWGGEEFVIILPATTLENAVHLAEKLRKKIENHDFNGIKVTVSFGVTEVKEDDNVEKVLNRADKALYKAKEKRNMVYYIK